MPRYYFHILHAARLILDEEGSILADADAAMTEARATARDVARQAIAQQERPADFCVEIHERDGRLLASLPVQEILEHPDNPAMDDGDCQNAQREETLH